MVVPVVYRRMGEMVLDRRVHVRVWRILVMHRHRFVELWECVRGWRLHRVDKLSRVGGIIVLDRWEEVARGGRGLRSLDVLFLGLGFDNRFGNFQCIILD